MTAGGAPKRSEALPKGMPHFRVNGRPAETLAGRDVPTVNYGVRTLGEMSREVLRRAAEGRRPTVEIIAPFLDRAPVDLEGMARALGLQVAFDPSQPCGVTGKIAPAGGGYRITVNGSHSPRRRRFSLAHELAHYIMHRDLIGAGVVDNLGYRSATLPDAIESQANRVAADLLMPAALMRRFHGECMPEAGMAARFGVPPEAVRIRMMDLRLETRANLTPKAN